MQDRAEKQEQGFFHIAVNEAPMLVLLSLLSEAHSFSHREEGRLVNSEQGSWVSSFSELFRTDQLSRTAHTTVTT
jgi:hypothetical protein